MTTPMNAIGRLVREIGPFRVEGLLESPFEGETDLTLAREESPRSAIPRLFPDLAVSPFSPALKSDVAPLLATKKVASAMIKNREALRSANLEIEAVRAAILASYVDEGALGENAQSEGRSLAGEEGFAILVHQAQTKFYATAEAHDGIAGRSFLASLGYLVRPERGHGGRPISAVKKAQGTIDRAYAAKPELFERALSGLTAANWFEHTMSPAFLGFAFQMNVHVLLVRQLRLAEAYLRRDSAYRDLSPAVLGKRVGIREAHKGGRVQETSKSMHTFGLALDVDYVSAPFILGDHALSRASHERFSRMTERATFLVHGAAARLDTDALDALGKDAKGGTRKAFDTIAYFDSAIKHYLALGDDESAREGVVAQRDAPSLVRHFGSSSAPAIGRTIREDARVTSLYYRQGRKASGGFLPLPKDFVVAMRDGACLGWGAIDFGAGSGDMMHFDMRASGLGRFIAQTNGGTAVPSSGHPCVSAAETKSPSKPAHGHTVTKPHPPRPATPMAHADRETSAEGTTLYLPQRLILSGSPTLPTTALFIPSGFSADTREVDVVLYLHGMKSPCGGGREDTIREMLGSDTFRGLRGAITASFRNVVLVAPTLGFHGEVHFDANEPWDLIDSAIKALPRAPAMDAPTVGKIVLAGHSSAGAHLLEILSNGGVGLAKVIALWGLDCTYSAARTWLDAIAGHPSIAFSIVRSTSKGTARSNATTIEQHNRAKNAEFLASGVNHCDTPVKIFPRLLAAENRLTLTPTAAHLAGARPNER